MQQLQRSGLMPGAGMGGLGGMPGLGAGMNGGNELSSSSFTFLSTFCVACDALQYHFQFLKPFLPLLITQVLTSPLLLVLTLRVGCHQRLAQLPQLQHQPFLRQFHQRRDLLLNWLSFRFVHWCQCNWPIASYSNNSIWHFVDIIFLNLSRCKIWRKWGFPMTPDLYRLLCRRKAM